MIISLGQNSPLSLLIHLFSLFFIAFRVCSSLFINYNAINEQQYRWLQNPCIEKNCFLLSFFLGGGDIVWFRGKMAGTLSFWFSSSKNQLGKPNWNSRVDYKRFILRSWHCECHESIYSTLLMLWINNRVDWAFSP